jgi:hypothetical protein
MICFVRKTSGSGGERVEERFIKRVLRVQTKKSFGSLDKFYCFRTSFEFFWRVSGMFGDLIYDVRSFEEWETYWEWFGKACGSSKNACWFVSWLKLTSNSSWRFFNSSVVWARSGHFQMRYWRNSEQRLRNTVSKTWRLNPNRLRNTVPNNPWYISYQASIFYNFHKTNWNSQPATLL